MPVFSISTDTIDQTCNSCAKKSKAFSYDVCLESLESVPVSRATNLQGLALIAMELALENATSTISTIIKFLDNETSTFDDDPFGLACMKDCLELYSNGVTTLLESVGDFLIGKYDEARKKMNSVMDATSMCEDGFMEKKLLIEEGNNMNSSPLTEENYNLFQLCDIALCIVNLLSLSLDV
ncbi:putative invertase inhibitor [Rutidosis leptorrhynchoides]|uniref:putative invertase inhibitor n=1 Tax=Rutidosis leptorrhynchoides TaxID=125765 RepID=UPI003A9A3D28